MRAVFFGLLGHQTDVLHSTRSCRVQRAGFFEIFDAFVIDGGIGIVRDHAICVVFLIVRAPALAACSDQRGHGRVDDHVRGYVKVGDALVRVDHIHRWTRRHCIFDRLLDLGVVLDPGHHVANTGVRVHACGIQFVAVFVEHGL